MLALTANPAPWQEDSSRLRDFRVAARGGTCLFAASRRLVAAAAAAEAVTPGHCVLCPGACFPTPKAVRRDFFHGGSSQAGACFLICSTKARGRSDRFGWRPQAVLGVRPRWPACVSSSAVRSTAYLLMCGSSDP